MSDPPPNSAHNAMIDSAVAPLGCQPRFRCWLGVAAATAIAGVLLYFHARSYLPFFDDDALISLRYARRLIDGMGLTWTDGPRVEGYSNLLWILLLALMGYFGVELIEAARILGYFCILGAMLAVSIAVQRPMPRSSSNDLDSGGLRAGREPPQGLNFLQVMLPALIGTSVMAAAAPIAVWSIGGHEQPLVLMLLAWGFAFLFEAIDSGQDRAAWRASICFALICLTRPDGPVFATATVAALLLSSRLNPVSIRIALIVACLPIAAVIGQTAFRLAYYGQWLPNPAYIKLTPSAHHFRGGVAYVRDGFIAALPVCLGGGLCIANGLFHRESRSRSLLLATHAVVWTLYLVFIGGDIFAAYRLYAPCILILSIALGGAMAWISETGGQRRARYPQARNRLLIAPARSVGLLLMMAIPILQFYWQQGDERIERARTQRTEWEGKSVGLLLRSAFADRQPTIAVDAAGAVPYWSQLPAIDMLGLCDYHIPRRRPAKLGSGFLGHEHGDGDYVFGRRPDLILFKDPRGRRHGVYLSGRQMQAIPAFRQDYVLATLDVPATPAFSSLIWIRRESPTIGIRRVVSPNGLAEVVIPAWLLIANPQTRLGLAGDGALIARASPNEPASIDELKLTPGHWKLDVDASGPLLAKLHLAGHGTIGSGAAPLTIEVPNMVDPTITLEFAPRGESIIDLRSVRFRRFAPLSQITAPRQASGQLRMQR